MRRPLTPVVPALAVVVATAGLASCGSSGGSSSTASASSGTPTATVAATTVAATSASTPATSPAASAKESGTVVTGKIPGQDVSPSAGTTAPGTTLKIGQSAVLDFHDDTTKKQGIVTVTVKSITKGSIGDWKNMELDAKDKTSTPYYIKLSVKNTGTTDLSGTDPQHFVSGIDDRGQEQDSVIVMGTFDTCNEDTAPKSLKPGTSFDACQPYLVAGGGSIKGAEWTVYDPKTNKMDVYWK